MNTYRIEYKIDTTRSSASIDQLNGDTIGQSHGTDVYINYADKYWIDFDVEATGKDEAENSLHEAIFENRNITLYGIEFIEITDIEIVNN